MIHILINGVWAATHMVEDYDHQHETEHSHFSLFSDSNEFEEDDYLHEHEGEAHVHLVFQLPETEHFDFIPPPVQKLNDCDGAFCSTTVKPPVPPPNSTLL